jgi:ATP-dependent NAD(P)H-hydrate dehydratase
LAYIFCMPEAATAIKSYAPELVVYPYLNPEDSVEQVMARVVPVLSKMHAVVIGPGLSTNPRMLDFAINVVVKCLELDCPTILDADALRIMALVKLKLTKNVFLTPNAFEFGRLLESQVLMANVGN